MWRRCTRNSIYHAIGQPATSGNYLLITQERRTRRLNTNTTHDGHAGTPRMQRRGLLRQGGKYYDQLRGYSADSASVEASSTWFLASMASESGVKPSTPLVRRVPCFSPRESRLATASVLRRHQHRRTAPAPATRASSGTRTTGAVAGRSSTRVPGRGCSAVLVM